MVATLSAVLYVGARAGAVPRPRRAARRARGSTPRRPTLPPRASWRSTRVALNVFGFFAVALLSGSLAERLQRAGARLERASSEIADLQAFNQHVIDSLPSGLATTDADSRILTFNRAAEAITGLAAFAAIGRPLAEVLQLPPHVASTRSTTDLARRARRAASSSRTARPTAAQIELGLDRDAPADARRPRRLPVHVPGRHRHQAARARRAAAAAARGGRRDGGRHRARDPQSAGVDVGLDSDAAAGAAAQRRAGAADGHRAARVGAAERHDPLVPGLRAAAAVRDRAARPPPRAERHGAAAAQQRRGRTSGTSSTSTCRRAECGSRPTRARSGRSSGTWRPTACARCPTAARCA